MKRDQVKKIALHVYDFLVEFLNEQGMPLAPEWDEFLFLYGKFREDAITSKITSKKKLKRYEGDFANILSIDKFILLIGTANSSKAVWFSLASSNLVDICFGSECEFDIILPMYLDKCSTIIGDSIENRFKLVQIARAAIEV